MKLKVVSAQAKIRESVELSSPIVSILKQGDVIKALEERRDDKGNIRVRVGDPQPAGWMTKTGNNGQVLMVPLKMKVVAAESKVRAGVELSNAVIRVLSQGRVVEVLDECLDAKGNTRIKISSEPEGWVTSLGNNGRELLCIVDDSEIDNNTSHTTTTPNVAGPSASSGDGALPQAAASSVDDEVANEMLGDFMQDIQEIEEQDKEMTSELQINRLLQPGSKYFNLNPFEVLRINPHTEMADVKVAYRRLSLLVHPDKNREDRDRAEKAFDAVNKAYKYLQDEEKRSTAMQVVTEVERRVKANISDKRKALKKDGYTGPIEEDDPKAYRELLRQEICKMFAEIELKKAEMEKLDTAYRAREEEAKKAAATKINFEKKQRDHFDNPERMDARVSNWNAFINKGSKKKGAASGSKGIKKSGFRPPKHNPESR